MTEHRSLQFETNIVWVKPIDTLPRYVREIVVAVPHRAGSISERWQSGIVGYAELKPDTPSDTPGMFSRRIFWLAPHDPYDGGGAPTEAVDPHTVAPGVAAKMTDRAWGKTKSDK